MDRKWKTYEELAAYLLNQFAAEFGLSRVEGKQAVQGQRSGTQWEIDAKGVREGNQSFIIVECRRYTTSKLNQEISYSRVDFDRASDGSNVYTVDIINSKTTYQFSKHFFIRAIERYDSSRKNILMDFLISYEPVPGTVAYAGYGSLLSRQDWTGSEFTSGNAEYQNMQRSLFFKLSYLFRF